MLYEARLYSNLYKNLESTFHFLFIQRKPIMTLYIAMKQYRIIKKNHSTFYIPFLYIYSTVHTRETILQNRESAVYSM